MTQYAVSRDGSADIQGREVPRPVRDALIRTAPPHYKAAVLTVLLGAADLTLAAIGARLLELANLGEWTTSKPEWE